MFHDYSIPFTTAWCPTCKMGFGIAVEDGQILCPVCRKGWKMPIVRITRFNEYACLACHVTFSTAIGDVPTCHQCHVKAESIGLTPARTTAVTV